MPKVVVIGEILVEIMGDQIGQSFLQPGCFSGPFPSGSPAIFIDQVAKLGISSGIVATVGDDDFGRVNLNRLQADGVDISRIKITPENTTGAAFVTYTAEGDRQFIFHFTHSAAGMVSPADLDQEFFSDLEVLHVMGCSLTASPGLRETILTAVRQAKKRGKQVSFDPNIRPELLGTKEIQSVFSEILMATDILLTSKSELFRLTGTRDFDQAVKTLRAQGIGTIVVKNSAEGATVYHGNHIERVPGFSVVEVDPTGAGDCFDGAFIASLLAGKPMPEVARIANAAGAMSVTARGPMEGTRTLSEILAFTASAGSRP